MKIIIEKWFGNRRAIALTQGHQSFDLDLSGGSCYPWKTANTKEKAQSKTPVDGKRNTKGTSRKISRKKAV